MGLGLLVAAHGEALDTILEGGTGTNSVSFDQPQEMPERLESGTLNVPAIAGLRAGLAFVREKSRERILRHEIAVARTAWRALHALDQVELFTPNRTANRLHPCSRSGCAACRARRRPPPWHRRALRCAPVCTARRRPTALWGRSSPAPCGFVLPAFTTEQEIRSFAAVMRSVVRNSQDVHKERL